jgi:hypothetical protein
MPHPSLAIISVADMSALGGPPLHATALLTPLIQCVRQARPPAPVLGLLLGAAAGSQIKDRQTALPPPSQAEDGRASRSMDESRVRGRFHLSLRTDSFGQIVRTPSHTPTSRQLLAWPLTAHHLWWDFQSRFSDKQVHASGRLAGSR